MSRATRLPKELQQFYTEGYTDLFVVANENDIAFMHAIIVGPEGTPYEGGFFYFTLKFPNEYPFNPPHVQLMTTDRKRVRFNPNLYNDGKVCLSILGTWDGPSWSAVMNIATVLISIQSLMNDAPYHNEPGYERIPGKPLGEAAKKYNERIRHETMRVAVIGMLEEDPLNDNAGLPEQLRIVIEQRFMRDYYKYERIIEEEIAKDRKKGETANGGATEIEQPDSKSSVQIVDSDEEDSDSDSDSDDYYHVFGEHYARNYPALLERLHKLKEKYGIPPKESNEVVDKKRKLTNETENPPAKVKKA